MDVEAGLWVPGAPTRFLSLVSAKMQISPTVCTSSKPIIHSAATLLAKADPA